MYYMLYEKGNLDGMVSTNLYDFDLAGSSKFVEMVTKKVSQALDVSQVEGNQVRFTGIDVKKTELSMGDYARCLEEIEIIEDRSDELLTRKS